MKRMILVFAFDLFFLADCVTNKTLSQTTMLDDIIDNSIRDVELNISEGNILAIANFASPSIEYSECIIDELTTRLIAGRKFIIADRKRLYIVRAELQFQMSGLE
jgi:hypothetical protein